jgi:hypothetical protein
MPRRCVDPFWGAFDFGQVKLDEPFFVVWDVPKSIYERSLLWKRIRSSATRAGKVVSIRFIEGGIEIWGGRQKAPRSPGADVVASDYRRLLAKKLPPKPQDWIENLYPVGFVEVGGHFYVPSWDLQLKNRLADYAKMTGREFMVVQKPGDWRVERVK